MSETPGARPGHRVAAGQVRGQQRPGVGLAEHIMGDDLDDFDLEAVFSGGEEDGDKDLSNDRMVVHPSRVRKGVYAGTQVLQVEVVVPSGNA